MMVSARQFVQTNIGGTMPVTGDRAALLLVWAEPGQIPMINHGVDITLSREHNTISQK